MLLFTDLQVISMKEVKEIEKTGLPFGKFLSYDETNEKFVAVENQFGKGEVRVFEEWTACVAYLEGIPHYVAEAYALEIKKDNPKADDPNDTFMFDWFVERIERYKKYKLSLLFHSSKEHPEIVTLEKAEQGMQLIFKENEKACEEVQIEDYVIIPYGKGLESSVDYVPNEIRVFSERSERVSHNDFEKLPTMLFKSQDGDVRVGYGDLVLYGNVLVVSEHKDFGDSIKFLTPFLEKTRVTTCRAELFHEIHCFTFGKHVREEIVRIKGKPPVTEITAEDIF